MINRRSNVFETNSSSVHTITLEGHNVNDLVVEKDGYIHISLPYYGKELMSYNNSYDKLCYAILLVCYTTGLGYITCYCDDDSDEAVDDWKDCVEELKAREEYQEIEECVVTEINRQNRICYGLKLHISNCGFDHQSQDDYDSLADFLNRNNIETLHDFIFGGAVLHTDCD